MVCNRRHITRPVGNLRYRKLFVLSLEGTITERQYFASFNVPNSVIQIKCLKGNKKTDRSPRQVLTRMEHHLKEAGLKKTDEAWLVVDKDEWTKEQLSVLHHWSQQADNYGFALSNPKFEFWLILHFEQGDEISSSQVCSRKLKEYLPDYDKQIDMKKLSQSMIKEAIKRAKQKDQPPCDDWPHTTGTTVYKLVENILKSSEE